MKRVSFYLSGLWCYWMHPAPMWPVNGQYRCPSCQRQYPVPWENGETRWRYRPTPAHSTPRKAGEFTPEMTPEHEVAQAGAMSSLKRLLNA
jgi:hypothetical protein